MQVKDVINRAVNVLGLEDEVSVTVPSAKLNKLLDCTNMILQELTAQYVNLKTRETVDFSGGRAYYSDFDHGVREILEVRENGKSVCFLPHNEYLRAGVSGTQAEVTYIYFLGELNLTDEIPLPQKYTEYVLAMGVSAEYLFRTGLTEEGSFYKTRYETAVDNLSGRFRSATMPYRRLI